MTAATFWATCGNILPENVARKAKQSGNKGNKKQHSLLPLKPFIFKGTEKGALFIRRSTSFSIMLKNLAFHYSGIVGPPTRKEKYLLSDGYGSYNSLHIHHNRRQIGL